MRNQIDQAERYGFPTCAGPFSELRDSKEKPAAKDGAAKVPDQKQIKEWIEQLGNRSFSIRENASMMLEKAGAEALPALKDALKSNDIEVHKRAERLIDIRINAQSRSIAGWLVAVRAFNKVPPLPTVLSQEIDADTAASKCKELSSLQEILEDPRYLGEFSSKRSERFVDFHRQKEELKDVRKARESFQNLDLSYCFLTNENLAELVGQLKEVKGLHLHSLNLTKNSISDEGLAALKHLKELRTLTLDQNDIGDSGLAQLGSLKQLQQLSLHGTDVKGTGLAQLKDLKELRHINLPEITREGLQGLKELNNVQSLKLKLKRDITGADISQLEEMNQLDSLDLSWSGITDEQASGLKSIKSLRNLVLVTILATKV